MCGYMAHYLHTVNMHATYTFLAIVACALVILLATCSGDRIDFLEVHGPDGQVAWVNVAEISTLRAPTANDLHRYFPPGTHCVISTTNAKFVAAVEPCSVIRDRLSQLSP